MRIGKLKINKFAIRWNCLYLLVNPFAKGIYFWKAMKLNVKLIYTFFKSNLRRFYRWVFHIKPKSLFNYTYPEDQEFKDCWALNNLQPMEKIANIKKSNHYEN